MGLEKKDGQEGEAETAARKLGASSSCLFLSRGIQIDKSYKYMRVKPQCV